MLGSLGQNVIYLVDTSFIGRLSEYDLGASAIGGIFYFFLFMIGFGLNTGMQVIVARRKGEGNIAAIGEVIDHEIIIILLVALIAFVMMHFFSGVILSHIVKSDEVREKTRHFLQYRSFGIFCGLLNSLFMSFFIGIGNTRVTTWTTGVLVAVNVFLLYCLVFGNLGFPRMEIAGAGLASSIAEASVTVVILFYLFRKGIKKEYHLLEFINLKVSLFTQMLKLAGPLVFQQIISVGSWWIFFLSIEHLGERKLAISNLVRSLYAMYGVPVWALASTVNSMTSNLLGQGKSDEVIPLIKKVAVVSLSLAAIFGVIILLFPAQILSVFTNEKDLIADSISTLPSIILAILLFSVAILTMFGLMGTGATKISFGIEVICIGVYLTYIYFTAVKFECSLPVIWLTESVYWLTALLLCALYLKKGNWQSGKV